MAWIPRNKPLNRAIRETSFSGCAVGCQPATAVAVAILWPELLALSALRQYPFLDLRTSTFLFAITAAVAAIGLAGGCSLLMPRFNGLLAAGLAGAALVIFVAGTAPYVRSA